MTSGTNVDLNSIFGSRASDIYALGTSGTILHYNGSSWSSVASPTTNTLRAVWCSGSNEAYAVGANGTILRCGSRLVADINDDGYVNVGDLQVLVAAWGSTNTMVPPSGNWNLNADGNDV